VSAEEIDDYLRSVEEPKRSTLDLETVETVADRWLRADRIDASRTVRPVQDSFAVAP